MEFRNLYSFLRTAELGSFTKAAQELGYAQSTITTQIQQLESELGFPLFEHIGRRIDLTVHGREVITYANQILHIQEQILNLHHTNSADTHGTLRIGIVESIMNSTLLATIKTYQNVSLTCRFKFSKLSQRRSLKCCAVTRWIWSLQWATLPMSQAVFAPAAIRYTLSL